MAAILAAKEKFLERSSGRYSTYARKETASKYDNLFCSAAIKAAILGKIFTKIKLTHSVERNRPKYGNYLCFYRQWVIRNT